jgi:hypothetical protein
MCLISLRTIHNLLLRRYYPIKMAKKYLLGNYGLSIALFLLFFLSWAGQAIAGYQVYKDEAQHQGEEISIAAYMPDFWEATMENWQSEFLQLFTFVVLATYLIHLDSPQSRDGDDELQERVKRIEQMLSKKKA